MEWYFPLPSCSPSPLPSKSAGDLPRLSNLRATLRQRMESSPLMDAPAFARAIEDAYRTMWQTWCAKQNP